MNELTTKKSGPGRTSAPANRSFGRVLAGAVLGLALLAAGAGAAGGDPVALVPTCIVLDAGTDSALVVVHNRGTSTVAWQLDLVRMGRTASGSLRPLTRRDPAAAAVDTSIEVSPRECVLAPGESRTIRLRVHHSPSLPSGEYRSHLLVREKAALTSAGGDAGTGAGAAVPIVLRTGEARMRWRDEQFRAGATRGAPAIVILDLESGRSAAAI